MLLAGCAAEQAFREGKTLVSEGRMEEGLLRLEQAVKETLGRSNTVTIC